MALKILVQEHYTNPIINVQYQVNTNHRLKPGRTYKSANPHIIPSTMELGSIEIITSRCQSKANG